MYKGRNAEVYRGGREGYGAGAAEDQKFRYGYGFRVSSSAIRK